MIARGSYNPLAPEAANAIRRIRKFHEIIRAHSHFVYLPGFAMNDGGVLYRDLSPRSHSVTYDFVTRCWKLYREIDLKDRAEGHPGARMVIAAGFRARRNSRRPNKPTERLWRAVDGGSMTARRAISQAANFRTAFDIIPQLQANFAFAKSYLADNSGTKGGLPGPACYIDMALFADPPPIWLNAGPDIAWSDKGAAAVFRNLLQIDRQQANKCGHAGILNGAEIAERLTSDPEILNKLRQQKSD